ncbi:LysE family transporter [Planktotalea sp.]|uniref:LysE family translocator n=1 Tax=Planktotalea sp. TaxID=2029877 RepID=UPI0025DCA91F|nr:LysE family transporter [Planktotalea sp.]
MLLDPLYVFVFLGLFPPGPNIILLTASGAMFGFKRTVPHVLGVAVGVGITAGLTAFGLGAILLALPKLIIVLKVLAALWILWMAWGLWTATPSLASKPAAPMTFVQAVLFQWVNPKIWAIALAAVSAYSAGLTPIGEALRVGSAFSGINFFVCMFWTFAGTLLTFLLTSDVARHVFMRAMALALAAFSLMILA